jgi:preprotein translocase subunit SecG
VQRESRAPRNPFGRLPDGVDAPMAVGLTTVRQILSNRPSMSIVLSIFTFVLVVVSLLMVLVILMQRAKSDGGVGAALGGGMAEAAFGAESSNVLSRTTEYGAVVFFVLSFLLYLGNLHFYKPGTDDGGTDLPTSIGAPPFSEMPSLEIPAATPDDGATPATEAPAVPEAPASVDTPAAETPAGTPAPAPEL